VFGLKSRDPEFIKSVKNDDIIILQETWCRGDDPTGCPPGYKELVVPSIKMKGVTQGRSSGGMLIWFKSQLVQSIEIVKKGENNMWLKIKKQTILTPQNLFLCAIYIPPIESPYFNQDTFSDLENEISHFQTQGHVMICGDLNSRTGDRHDFVSTEGDDFITGDNIHFPTYSPRQNYDKSTNVHGKEVLRLCRSLGLYIVNGRLRGDSLGRYTYSSALGSSSVDYAITDLNLNFLRAFTVKPLTPLSDHSQITVYLYRTETPNICTKPGKMFKIKPSYKWGKESSEMYHSAVTQPETQALLSSFITTNYPHDKKGMNLAVYHLNNLFDHVAQTSNLATTKTKQKRIKSDHWIDSECKKLRKSLRKRSNQKHQQPDNQDIHIQYESLKRYKHTIRVKKNTHIQNQLKDIEESINSNKFWDNWKHLNKRPRDELAILNGDIWKEHFTNLFDHPILNSDQQQISERLENLEIPIKDNQNPLDFPITQKEVEGKLHNLQPRKACGVDGILNEMLVHTDPQF